MSPIARKTALAKNVDISSIQGTGPNNRVILADIEDAIKAGGSVKVAKDVEVKKVVPPSAKPADLPSELFTDIKVS